MQIPEYIEIKLSNKTVAYLSPESDGLKDCYPDSRLNGESTLEFSLPSNSEKIKELTAECEIYANDRVYNILKDEAIDEVMDEQGRMWTKFMAVERWNLLDTQFPEPYITNDPSIPSPADLAVIIVGGGTNLSGGTYPVGTAAHALYAVLQGSDWSMGICDVTGIHDLEAEKISRLQLIKQIQETWGGYLVWDSVNKVVHLRNGELWQNYNGFQIRYAKNMKHINRTQSNKIITKLYCFGKDDLDIASVNGGLKYVTDYSYTNNDYIGIYSNPDIEDAEELKQLGLAELALNSKPRYNYNTKIVDLRVLPEYSHENFTLGDMVDIINPKSEIEDNVRIIRHKYNLFQPWQCELELGDPNERLVEKLKASFDTNAFIDRMFDSMGNMSGKRLVDGSVINNKIADAAIDASKINVGVIFVLQDEWTNKNPDANSISWNNHKIYWNGKEYLILGGNTSKKYVYWDSETQGTNYGTADSTDLIPKSAFIIAINNDGLHEIYWHKTWASKMIDTSQLADEAVIDEKIAEAAVTTKAIADFAVDVNKLADLAVEASKLAGKSVTAEKIANLAVGSAAIQEAAIGTAHIANAAILTAHIQDAQISTAKIIDAAITSAKIADLAVGSAAIQDAAIGSAMIADLAVKTAHIANAAITNAKIAELAVQNANIANLAVDALKIGNTAITEEKLANLAVTTNKIADLAITNAKIANATITAAKIERLIVGDNVEMGPNAYISWSNVLNRPSIPTVPGYIKSTYIDSTRIESPEIYSGEMYSGIYYGNGSNPASVRIGITGTNFADLALYRGGSSTPMFRVFDGVPVVLLQALNSSNVLSTFLETTGNTSKPRGAWNFSSATVTGIDTVAKFK